MTNKWIIKSLTDEQEKSKEALAKDLSISPILAQLLVQRGITDYQSAKEFFRPSLSMLHDPFLMTDMRRAVDRLTYAMQRNEKILVYGDYDVDGTTAVALVYKFIKELYANVDFYIPDRYAEGYGISIKGIDYAADNGFTLIIALDCGIKAVGKVAYAKSRNVDFIICDHHTADEMIPPAVAVLDPKRPDCNYPYSELSGCGVGFKFMQAFAQVNKIPFSHLEPLLDLVALSIASDIVPITGENRVLAHYGLKRINHNPCVGIKSIIEVCGLAEKEIDISDIVFKIGPRINASGRIRTAAEAVQLLITRDASFARQKSSEIDEYNNDRKDLDKSITDEAQELIQLSEEMASRSSIVVYKPDWHKGVVGIVASRLTEEYYKPAIVLTNSNGLVSGSARSVGGFDIYAAIDSCRDLLETFGGHVYAAGLSMQEKHVPEFTRRFEEYVAQHILPSQQAPQVEIDSMLTFREITPKFFRILKQFGPFGPGNQKPIFATEAVYDSGNTKAVGREQEHLRLEVKDSTSKNSQNGIAFRKGQYNSHLKNGGKADICYTMEENTFNGNTSLQLMIKDIRNNQQQEE